MTNPHGPVSLMVSSSARETARAAAKEADGPKAKPPMARITSLGSYFKKSTSGTRPTAVAA